MSLCSTPDSRSFHLVHEGERNRLQLRDEGCARTHIAVELLNCDALGKEACRGKGRGQTII